MTSEVAGIFPPRSLKTTDVYDPDRLAADLESVRRYLPASRFRGHAIVSSDVVFDESRRGYVITIRR